MRTILAAVAMVSISPVLLAQPASRRPATSSPHIFNAEMAVKRAIEQLGNDRKAIERDLEVLRHLHVADNALVDPMQPSIAIQKAYEEIDAAKGLGPEFAVMQGIIRVHEEITAARRSPGSADFGRLRALLRTEAMRPANRVVLRNTIRLEEETLAWIKIQEFISQHLRALSELAGEGLRASQQ